jgi:subtilase family serine protease
MRRLSALAVAAATVVFATLPLAGTANAMLVPVPQSANATAAAPTPMTPAWFAAHHVRPLCDMNTKPGVRHCMALQRTDIPMHLTAGPHVDGLGPSDIQSAYNLPSSSAGSGATVAIVDANDDPNAESDLATYRSNFSLPECSTANGCFKKVDETGGSNYPNPDAGWSGEIALDVDMVSATCPNCHILLVEAASANNDDLGKAVNEAVKEGAKYVSNSYGGAEDSSETSEDSQYYSHPGVAVTASTGDSGYGVSYPAASNAVVSVGGTNLSQGGGGGRAWNETAWTGAGSGCSANESKPSWQKDSGCTMRADADVSAVADPQTGVATYNSYQSGGWGVIGGTSASSPIIASTFALAGTPGANDNPASYLYANPSALNDITSGSNGTCDQQYLCNAGPGYDGPTGLGTPNGVAAFKAGGGSIHR